MRIENCVIVNDNLNDDIAVALSGGPDSTALLFLWKRLLDSAEIDDDLPRELVAFTVDHGLQSTSAAMSARCAEIAHSMNIPHRILSIPWSIPPFPPLPQPGAPFEGHARRARYHILLGAMRRAGAEVIAFGHHLDDQVETAIMRMAKGSSELGMSGMRLCRRWGMGIGDKEGDLAWAGHAGMKHFIVRPLLNIPKVRHISSVPSRFSPVP